MSHGESKPPEYLGRKDVAVYYLTSIYRQPLYNELSYRRICMHACIYPVAEETCKRVLSLPVHPSVAREDGEYVLDVLGAIEKP